MSRTLVIADRLVTGPGGRVVDGGAVLVDGDTITAVGPAAELDAAAEPEVARLRCPGATVLPGLIDCHVHLAFDAGPNPMSTVAQADPDDLAAAMADRAGRLLTAGVTTARDLGDRDALAASLRASVESGEVIGPRIRTATTPLTSRGGHCGFLGGEISGEDEIRARIAANAAAGADLVKVMASGGALTPNGPRMWEPQFTADELRLIVDEAARHGLGVAAHAHGTDTIADCVAAGVRTLEHCSWRTAEANRYDPEITREIVENDISVCRCVSGDWRLFLQQLGPRRADALAEMIRSMREAGVRFIAGTDAGVPGAGFADYVGMLEFFVSLGFTHAEVLDMATANAAHALGLADSGVLAAGMRADLLVVNGNPLSDMDALRRTRHVVAAGRIITDSSSDTTSPPQRT